MRWRGSWVSWLDHMLNSRPLKAIDEGTVARAPYGPRSSNEPWRRQGVGLRRCCCGQDALQKEREAREARQWHP